MKLIRETTVYTPVVRGDAIIGVEFDKETGLWFGHRFVEVDLGGNIWWENSHTASTRREVVEKCK